MTKVINKLKNPRQIKVEWKTNLSNHLVDLSEFTIALPRNSFPEINHPDFIGREEAYNHFLKNEPVIAVAINGEAKAYPLAMLTIHELSNDILGGNCILPTFCPLCNSSIVYNRKVEINGKEKILDFEVSGMLRNSDMVMFDRQTETWWQQLEGKALVGELAGYELEVIPSMVISLEDFFARYKNGIVLSPLSGENTDENYSVNPYENYDNKGAKPYERYFNETDIDERLPAMERLIVLSTLGEHFVYPFGEIKKKGVINDGVHGRAIVLFYEDQTVSVLDKKIISKSAKRGSATVFSPVLDNEKLFFKKENGSIIDDNTGSTWDIGGRCVGGELKGHFLSPVIHANHFAFAWLKFHPESYIYGQ